MGNQLTGIAPSQILPVEHYLQDVPEYEFDVSLGSTRFFKVARARYVEGLVVVKVFVIHDPSLPLKSYRDGLEKIAERLNNASNVLPFQKATMSDKAAMLFRQYIKDSLYDRISTRPFLSDIEKHFLAFQLLCALNQCHKLNICHGDIKSENLMVTSWNWLLLADFASFKPTYLPEDNPADFSYFFDTSRRRTCYIAPERFVKSSYNGSESVRESSSIDLPTASNVKKGDLTPAMDIFSAGCVITELFTEGNAPFDLSELLAYRTGEYSPTQLIQSIDDVYIRDLVRQMMQKDPKQRLTAEEYMVQQKGKAFPDYFYTFLKTYLQRFASSPIISPDDRISRVKQDLPMILDKMKISLTDPEENISLVQIITLVTSALRNLHLLKSKLIALETMLELSTYVTADIVLDRVVPFMLFMVNDAYAQVRGEAVRTITLCLSRIKSVPLSDANIFPEYILPQMGHLTQDSVTSVRVIYAENIALLSETASRFLEIVQLNAQPMSMSSESKLDDTSSHYKATYDIELEALHEMIQNKVVTLLSDTENIVKQTLLENGITRLCVFFGRQKANDVLLSHMITFLNNKEDWKLRGAFFDAIVGIAAYVGWHSSTILKPLLQQGLSDTEEFVIHKTLVALQALVEMSLIQKPMNYEILHEVAPFLCHPNTWIRQGAVGFVSALAKRINVADVHCNLLPTVKSFLKQDVLQVDKELILLHSLSDPVTRPVYDYILRSPNIERLFDCLQDRQLIRNICRQGHSPNYSDLDNTMANMFRKLQSEGMKPEDENKLLSMKDFMLKLHKTRAGSDTGSLTPDSERSGSIQLGELSVTRRHADLLKIGDSKQDLNTAVKKPQIKRKLGPAGSPTTLMNEDWKQMFGSNDIDTSTLKNRKEEGGAMSLEPVVEGVASLSNRQVQSLTLSVSQLQVSSESSKKSSKAQPDKMPAIQSKYAMCKLDLRRLVYRKKNLFSEDQMTKDLLDNTVWESRPPPAKWKPKGLLVAHLHEHRGAVNRVKVNQEHSYFATCSNDGSVKVFDCHRMEGKSVTNRSRMTYNKQDGQIKTLTFCESSQSIAFVADKGDSGTINVFRVETGSAHKYTVLYNNKLNVEQDGMVVDLLHFDTGSQNILAYATVNGSIIGWDLRTSKEAWRLQNDPKQGLVTSFDIHPKLSWMVLGTSNGTMACWDMRFKLPVTSIAHPTGARVRRVIAHPTETSTIISAVQGNNEISFWDLETASRHKTLWASTAPSLSQTQATVHSVNGLYYGKTDTNSFLLAAGSDMRVRYWDLCYAANSQLITGSASDPIHNQTAVSYRSRLIDGTEVIQETYGKQKIQQGEDMLRKGPDIPATGHHDIITDITICQPSQCFMITSSRDGVVKVWK